ncbi:serine/threonine-protein kinase pim-1 isoform X2 [Nematostella vectensis]|uniref:serine/threonine-protein kinase pim-1 isoform X2 n=1 Tax=Nematostella vectensis TaxID=45351 RepID=UPI0013902F1A|nr:serine/threonine-protein kinase pim-1 isoform X2 [Nematostella vectensis]
MLEDPRMRMSLMPEKSIRGNNVCHPGEKVDNPETKYYGNDTRKQRQLSENASPDEKSSSFDMASEAAKRKFSALLSVICRTAKKSANKVTRIRKGKQGVEDTKKSTRCDNATIQAAHSYGATASDQGEPGFKETYELLHLIGRGGFAMVYAGTRVRDGKPVAIKVIPKNNVYFFEEVEGISVPMEVYLHRVLDHPNVVRLYDYFEYNQAYVLVLERPTHYRDLFDYITEKKLLSEREAKDIFKQVVHAVAYCEGKGVFHRDIKDENLLLDTKTGQVKLFDFGSGTVLENTLYTDYEGTRAYCPPEWFRFHRYHARPCTVWSLGILLFNMLSGDVPFANQIEIVRGELNFAENVSKEAQSLVRWLLAKHPSYRPTLENILKHPWLGSVKYRRSKSPQARCHTFPENYFPEPDEYPHSPTIIAFNRNRRHSST